MLFQSSLRRELARSFGATLIVLVTVVMTMTLIRTLGQASRGSFNPSDVMMVMGYTVLTFMPNVITMGLFVATVATLTRIYRDSEMVIWFGGGIGIKGLIAPLFRFAWPVLLAVAGIALFVYPWSNQQIDGVKALYEKRGDLERVEPGQFQESSDGSRVFFVEKSPTGQRSGNNVFISTTENGKETITTAQGGRVENVGPDHFLLLSNGQRLENSVGKQDLKVSEFAEYGAKFGTGQLGLKDTSALNTISSFELMRRPTPRHLGELSWRLGFAIVAANLIIIAVASSHINPRLGRTGNMVFSLFVFQLYVNLLNLGQNWIATEKLTFWAFMILIHGGMAALAVLWLAKRHNNWVWWAMPAWRVKAPTKAAN